MHARSHLLERPLQLAVLPAETYDSCDRPAVDSGTPVLFPHGGAMAMLVQRAVALWEAGQSFFANRPAGEDPAAEAAVGDATSTLHEDAAETSGAADPGASQPGDGGAATTGASVDASAEPGVSGAADPSSVEAEAGASAAADAPPAAAEAAAVS